MTKKTERINVPELLECVFWMIFVCASILQLACGLFILGGKDIAVLKWWYAGSLVTLSFSGIMAITLAYKIRKVNAKTQRALSNARMLLVISWVDFIAIPLVFGGAVLNSYLLGRTDAFSLVLSSVFVLAFSLIFPLIFYLETRPQKSVWA